LLAEYIKMLQTDVESFLINDQALKDVACPACESTEYSGGFKKFAMSYHECAGCGTVYISPRPGDESIAAFYRAAPSRSFWVNKLYEATRIQRREKIIKPRMEWVSDSIAEHRPRAKHWVHWHASQLRYAEGMAAATSVKQKTLLCPYFGTAGIPAGITVDPSPWWNSAMAPADVITLFELLDQTSDVAGLLVRVRAGLIKGGLCFITAILSSGFDVRELGAQAGNIFPPDRLNAFSVKGLRILLEKNGFDLLELSTPGILDVDIVQRALEADPGFQVSPFVRDLVLRQPEEVKRAFQAFLQENLLSSYGRVLVRRD
jgi:hypothetical protein